MNPEKKSSTFFIIDGFAQIFRAYYAVRSLNSPVTNEPTNATFGFVGMLLKLYREYQPDYLVVAMDVGGDEGTFRKQLDPQYKANRDPAPEDMFPQVDRIQEILKIMGVPVIGVPSYEADDVIATLCKMTEGDQAPLINIVSKDKDLHQLLNERVQMCDVHKDVVLNQDGLMADKGIKPEQVVDMLALMGDNADNIPGAQGVGPKTACKLIAKYGSIDALYENLEELKGKQKERVTEAEERVRFNIKMVKLVDDIEFEFELEQAKVKALDHQQLEPLFKMLGFNRHLKDLRELAGVPEEEAAPVREASKAISRSDEVSSEGAGLFASVESSEAPVSEFKQVDEKLYQMLTTKSEVDMYLRAARKAVEGGAVIAVDTETTDKRPRWAKLCGVSLSIRAEEGVYIPIRSPENDTHLDELTALELLKPFLEDESIPKIGQNLKYDQIVLRGHGVELKGIVFDTMLASFLIDASRSSHGMDDLAKSYLGYEPVPTSKLLGTGKKQITFDQVPLDQAYVYAAEDTDITYRLYETLAPRLKATGLRKIFDEVELPLLNVLAELEYNGIQASEEELETQKKSLSEGIEQLRDEIHELAGEAFNVDSTKQLAEILFTKLKCKVIRRGKTGPSTNAEVLDRISNEQEPPGSIVAAKVLEYRELTKLMNTYMDGLKDAILPVTGRIHTSFHQTGAGTGRLSSSDPNLQNIPIRRESGRRIRKAFTAGDGQLLLAADYSQVELRVLAHLSEDEGLIRAFTEGLDIHRAVAAEVFDVAVDQVSAEQRSAAKMVNFGIVYGISAFGLARRLGTSAEAGSNVELAAKIIDDYKTRYPKISAFLNDCVAKAQEKGYVETMLGRRRPIPQINSRNGNERKLGERMAINSVVQGSAADLIKLAMIQIQREIETESRPMKMLLQIHDELVFEVPESSVENLAGYVSEKMCEAMTLKVPLKVDAHWGKDWYSTK